jgi:hypothetical protein
MERHKHFKLTEEHIKLLQRAYVYQEQCEWGLICVDGKRPFGNGDIAEDMAEILGLELFEDAWGEKHFNKEQHALLLRLFSELGTALQVVLRTLSFEPGEYEADRYDTNWRRVR